MRWPRWLSAKIIGAAFALILIAGFLVVIFGKFYYPPPPPQPIPFSHHVHVTGKQLSCFFCHPYATVSDHAGIPPVEKCYLCHKVIASKFWPIAKVVRHYRQRKPIEWKRVYYVPDFTHFSHQAHLSRHIDCGVCHGDVARMDRVGQTQKIDMNWCIRCHWKNNASDSCYTCHY